MRPLLMPLSYFTLIPFQMLRVIGANHFEISLKTFNTVEVNIPTASTTSRFQANIVKNFVHRLDKGRRRARELEFFVGVPFAFHAVTMSEYTTVSINKAAHTC